MLDAGRPLDAPDGATGLLPRSLDLSRSAAVLISHPHQDHWGLVEELPEGRQVPVETLPPRPLWNTWPVVALLLGLLIAEWLLRRTGGMS